MKLIYWIHFCWYALQAKSTSQLGHAWQKKTWVEGIIPWENSAGKWDGGDNCHAENRVESGTEGDNCHSEDRVESGTGGDNCHADDRESGMEGTIAKENSGESGTEGGQLPGKKCWESGTEGDNCLLHRENRNAGVTQICVIFTFGHRKAMHHSLNIAMVNKSLY